MALSLAQPVLDWYSNALLIMYFIIRPVYRIIEILMCIAILYLNTIIACYNDLQDIN